MSKVFFFSGRLFVGPVFVKPGWLARCLLVVIVVLAGLQSGWAQPGNNDPTFLPGSGANNFVNSVALQADGKILIGGSFTAYNSTARNRIARLNADGSLDLTFNPGTGVNSTVRSIVQQGDGKILIGGDFSTYNGTGRNGIARLNADGSLDTDFNPGTGTNSTVRSIALQGDGKILIGGDFSTYNGTARNRVARLNADGSLDTDFNPGSGATGTVYSVALQTDGKVLIGGEFYCI